MKKIKLLIPAIGAISLLPMVSMASCSKDNPQPSPDPEYVGPLEIDVDDETHTAFIYGLDETKELDPNLVIPEKVIVNDNEYTVTGIGIEAFADTDLKTISLPNTITEIGEYAFEGCQLLEEINIPTSLTTIEPGLFYYCKSLKKLAIPASVEEIDASALRGCVSLSNITVDENNKNYFSKYDGTETNCIMEENANDGINLIFCCGQHIPSIVTNIGDYACQTNPNIDENLFIPKSVQTIGNYAFEGCYRIKTLIFEKHESDAALESIGNCAFDNCYDLKDTNLILPKHLKKIGSKAFNMCTKLEGVTLPESLVELGALAFKNCGIKSVFIPENVEIIGTAPFSMCDELESITVSQNNKNYFSYNNGNNCNCIMEKDEDGDIMLIQGSSNPVNLPNNLYSINHYAFQGSGITDFTVPSGVAQINSYAFDSCKSLKNIAFNTELNVIQENAFFGDTNLESIYIPAKTKAIDGSAFDHCTGLLNIMVDPANTIITSQDAKGNECDCIMDTSRLEVIQGCSNTRLPSTIQKIRSHAFFGCDMVMFSLPESLVEIGKQAFANCSSLWGIYYPGKVENYKKVVRGYQWHYNCPAEFVICDDGYCFIDL